MIQRLGFGLLQASMVEDHSSRLIAKFESDKMTLKTVRFYIDEV